MSERFLVSRSAPRLQWRADGVARGDRETAEEAAVALVYDGGTEAVMMATPADLEDFAYGFSLTEAIVARLDEIESVERLDLALGIEVRMRLAPASGATLAKRRRTRAGPVGCGLCGVESLEAAMAPAPRVTSDARIEPAALIAAMTDLSARQQLNQRTHAVHGAGFYTPREGLIAVREDVGRHNALDKLAGALFRLGRDASGGAILMSSRLSVDLIQKAARLNAPMLAAASAPTALAVRTAEAAGIALAAIVREDGLEVFTRAEHFGLPGFES